MNRRNLLATSGAILGAFAGCVSLTEDASAVPSPGLQIGTDVDESVVDALVEGNTTFALDFLEMIVEEDPSENHLVSPLSLSIALAMTWAGARGATDTEMAETLHFPFDQETLHLAMGGLLSAMSTRKHTGDDSILGLLSNDTLQLALANQIWPREGLSIKYEFLKIIESNYAATPESLDFPGDAEGAREEINDWVATHTNDLIDELLPAESVDATTMFVLTNAIYLLANWNKQFDPDATTDEVFTGLDGSTEDIPMMSQTADVPYSIEDDCRTVELPYVGEELSMVIILPAEGDFETFESTLTTDRIYDIFDELTKGEVALSLPRFTLEADYSLRQVLGDLGMASAFDSRADFSGIIGQGNLWIDDVYHDAYISVDETGTEAAAATAVTMTESAPSNIHVNRPFLFLIRDRLTNSVLFIGRMVHPPTPA